VVARLGGADQHRLQRHAVGRPLVEQGVAVALHLPAQVTVGESCQQRAVGLGHRGKAEALAGHLEQPPPSSACPGKKRGTWSPVCIRSSTPQQLLAQRPPGWSTAKSSTVKPRRSSSRHAERIPHGQGGRGGGRGRQAQRTGLGADRDVEVDVRRWATASGRCRVSGEHGRGQALQPGHQGQDLFRIGRCARTASSTSLSRCARVPGTLIASARMQEQRGRTGGGQGWREKSSGR